uniref:Uncharacterized protein LOC105138036 n=1 Tax=Rhizophora mucronata TaxID=61149 RepID=A0A2P2KKQ7_RHIMU
MFSPLTFLCCPCRGEERVLRQTTFLWGRR